MKHQMQHPDNPTWCIHCGTFAHNCKPHEECTGKPGEFDCDNPAALERMIQILFGTPLKT